MKNRSRKKNKRQAVSMTVERAVVQDVPLSAFLAFFGATDNTTQSPATFKKYRGETRVSFS